MNTRFMESKIKDEVKNAILNVIANGEELDIPFKYSDNWEFTDALEDELDRRGFEFENSFRDKRYGAVDEYFDGEDRIYLIMDQSVSNRGICVGLVDELI